MYNPTPRPAPPRPSAAAPRPEPLALEPGTVSLDLDPGRFRFLDAAEHSAGLVVRRFAVDHLIVEFEGHWPFELHAMPARLEYVDQGGFTSQLRCRVEYSEQLDLEGVTCVRLELEVDEELRIQLRRVDRALRFPRLLDREVLEPAQVADLFRDSGYLSLRELEQPAPARWFEPEFARALSSDVVYVADDGALLGHVSVTRAYSKTWLGHQLTTLRGHEQSADCREALYHHFATLPALHDGDAPHYLLGYYDRSKRWHQFFFEGFVSSHDRPDEAVLVPFDRFEVRERGDTAPLALPGDEGGEIEIDQASFAERGWTAGLIREQLPALAAAAFDATPERLDRAYLADGFAELALPRGRRCFALREDGEFVGAALCETGSHVLSLFDVFNLGQLYFSPEASGRARRALAEFVTRHYRAQGCRRPMIVSMPGALPSPSLAGLEHIETMGCIVWSGRALPAYRRYLDECFARIERSRLQRKRAS